MFEDHLQAIQKTIEGGATVEQILAHVRASLCTVQRETRAAEEQRVRVHLSNYLRGFICGQALAELILGRHDER